MRSRLTRYLVDSRVSQASSRTSRVRRTGANAGRTLPVMTWDCRPLPVCSAVCDQDRLLRCSRLLLRQQYDIMNDDVHRWLCLCAWLAVRRIALFVQSTDMYDVKVLIAMRVL